MSKPTTIEQLTHQIEKVVLEYVTEGRRAAHAALERAFTGASEMPSRKQVASRGNPSTRSSGRRRSSKQLAELGEQLHEVVRAHPGESMATFAAELGMTVRELHRPMSVLKREGRVRTVGQRHLTRYFPGVAGKVSARPSAA
jgi:DNA-binding NtrC family response regulator